MKNILLSVLLLLISNCVKALSSANPRGLEDLPSMSSETIRWNMPADSWRLSKGYFFKGKALRISPRNGSFPNGIEVHSTPDVTRGQVGTIQVNVASLDGSLICDGQSYSPPSSESGNLWYCKQYYCEKVVSAEERKTAAEDVYNQSDYLLNFEKFQKCNREMHYLVKESQNPDPNYDTIYDFLRNAGDNTSYPNFYFETDTDPKGKDSLIIKVDKKNYFIDIRACKNDDSICQFVDITESDFEKDWIQLKSYQSAKNNQYFNTLISELLPCVLSRDKKCIASFFPDPKKDKYLEDVLGYFPKAVTIDDDLIMELRSCLKYENLLPHRLGARGVRKVCIFSSRLDSSRNKSEKLSREEKILMGVAYPEAIRLKKSSKIYFSQ